MKLRTRNLTRMTALTIAATATLAGCTINIGDDSNGMMNGNGMMSNSAGELSASDLMFAQMMIPHHQQAVDMGTLAETRAANPAVKELAAKIKGEQAPEIAQMKGWLGSSYDLHHTMVMKGMLDVAQLTELKTAVGVAFDQLYLTYMIAHHEGAIEMAQSVVDSKNSEVSKLAKSIIESQTAEIDYMKQLLGN
jgi:uncharacterized protein (DUF305 family)